MSTRQLRKLQKQRELAQASEGAKEDREASDESDELVRPAPKPRVSLFAALGGEDEEEEEEEEADAGEEVRKDSTDLTQPQTTEPAKRSKKKKKKKKKAATTTAVAVSAEPEATDEDEIDKAIKELQINKSQNAAAAGTDTPSHRTNELLKINTYHLKALNEMRNLFGREAMEAADAEEAQENTRRRRGAVNRQVDLETYLREPPGAKKLPEVTLRRNIFIQGRDHWPRQTSGGLSLKEVRQAPDGSWTEYAFCHEKDYDAMQTTFFAMVQMGDPMRLVHMLKECPYHVSTQLQVSAVAKQDQNMALASELCERALFTFGRLATLSFRQNIEAGRARLDFRRPENREFWLAGFHYIRSLIRKGTYRTALEWAKLIYTLDPKDPYAMRHLIHFLAVRAHESRWLVDFLNEMERTNENRDLAYLQQTLILAKLQMGSLDEARQDLTRGMRRLPWLYCALFQELNLDAPPSIWGIHADSDARSFWVKLYILKTKDLWNNTQATDLLKSVAKALDRIDVTELPRDDAPADRGATRLVYLEGETSLLGVAPRHLLESQPNYDFDPLPPPEEENIFTNESTHLPWLQQDHRRNGQTQEMLEQMQNLLGRRAVRLGPVGDADEDEAAAELEDDEELRRDLEAHAARANEPGLLATLMQLLGVGRAADQRNDGADRADGSSDEMTELDVNNGEMREDLPGSWPEEDGGSGNERRGGDARR
ncbi:hypothetical protein S7711_06864 [Stachybotrys chartarum IBT 7711]|uniref:Transcription factor 25 n=1 Tax=Stachybotrys chartarum (strain CBS 109288 / IBT 7711) TaxID=1280523 RepID=A0A084ANN5_STACB|nr:hypothetical protein S7711_06864 [Stachybotrys chartarum IBT 7711]